jgi:hypothetical protein
MAGGAADLIGKGGAPRRVLVLAVALGPFADSDAAAALATGFAGVAVMGVQNAVQRMHLASLPPGTLMTGNSTQAALDAIARIRGANSDRAAVCGRFDRMFAAIVWFAAGCALAATLYVWVGFWCLAVPALIGAAGAVLAAKDFAILNSPRDIFSITSLCIGNARHSAPAETRGMAFACRYGVHTTQPLVNGDRSGVRH